MPFPQFQDKYNSASITSAKEFLEYAKKSGNYPSTPAPETVIIFFQTTSFKGVCKEFPNSPCKGVFKGARYVDGTDYRLALMGRPGIGAPMIATHMEQLAAWGVKNFIALGTAGSLQKDLQAGDIILCERALRDDGISHHYLPDHRFAHPSPILKGQLEEFLRNNEESYQTGTTWTIDALYRETIAELEQYQSEGFKTVEMEAAAMFALGEFLHLHVASLFVISDSFADGRWLPEFYNPKKLDAINNLALSLVRHLSKT